MYIMMKSYKESACIVFYDTGILARFKVIIYVLTSTEIGRPKFLFVSNSIQWDEIPIPF